VPTLELLPASLPIYAVDAAAKTLCAAPSLSQRRIVRIGASVAIDAPAPGRAAAVTLRHFSAPWYDPTHGVLLFDGGPGNRAVYAPHGVRAGSSTLDQLRGVTAEVVLVTLTEYRLPWILGGPVNAGEAMAHTLAATVNAAVVIDIHSENKRAGGLVARLATIVTQGQEQRQEQGQEQEKGKGKGKDVATAGAKAVRVAPWDHLREEDLAIEYAV
jgi:hypothetical protein